MLVPSSLRAVLLNTCNGIKLRLIRSVPVSDDDRHGISNHSRGSIPVVQQLCRMVWQYASASNNHIYQPSANEHGLSALTLWRTCGDPCEVYCTVIRAISNIKSLRSTELSWLAQGSES